MPWAPHRMSLATLFEEKRQGDLLALLKNETKPSKPDELGKIGRDHLADNFDTYGAGWKPSSTAT